MLQSAKSHTVKFILYAALLVGAVALVRDTIYQGQDFEVMWKCAGHVLNGEPAYALWRDGPMVYKYPPWILPFLFPLAVMPLFWAKLVWGLVQVASIFSVGSELIRRGAKREAVVGVGILFWGIWAVHALDGQITLPLMALLFFLDRLRGPVAGGVALMLSPFKVFTIAMLPGMRWVLSLKSILIAALLSAVVSIPIIYTASDWGSFKRGGGTITEQVVLTFQNWKATAASSNTHFDQSKIRGRDNQSLTALVSRVAGVDATQGMVDVSVWFLLLIVLGGLSLKYTRSLPDAYQLPWWLAFSAAIHPLAWFHHFVLVFPLAAVVVSNAPRSFGPRVWTGVGVACVALVTRKTLGSFGEWVELISVKGIGAAILLWIAARQKFALRSWYNQILEG